MCERTAFGSTYSCGNRRAIYADVGRNRCCARPKPSGPNAPMVLFTRRPSLVTARRYLARVYFESAACCSRAIRCPGGAWPWQHELVCSARLGHSFGARDVFVWFTRYRTVWSGVAVEALLWLSPGAMEIASPSQSPWSAHTAHRDQLASALGPSRCGLHIPATVVVGRWAFVARALCGFARGMRWRECA
jgi:hypothetical protein